MFNTDTIQYVIKQSSGKVWNFYFDNRLGLCYCLLTKRNTWSEPVILHKGAHRNFNVDVDQNDNIYILFQDEHGNIFMSTLTGANMKTIPVLNSKSPSAYDKHFKIVPFRNIVHLFYVLKHNGSMILTHQSVSEEKVTSPRVVDYVVNNQNPYDIVSDSSENIYAFYQSSDSKVLQMGYKKYIPAQKIWSEFTAASKSKDDCEYPHTIVDSHDIIHVCYQYKADGLYDLAYQQKVPDKNIWTDKVLIHRSSYPFEDCSIVYFNNILTIFWIRSDIIYFSSSANQGVTWSKPAKYMFQAARQLMCMSFRSNSIYNSEAIRANCVPGSFINGYRLAFMQPAGSNNITPSPEDLKAVTIGNVKDVKSDIEELKKVVMELKDAVANINTAQQELSKEFTKLSVKVSYLENNINQYKPMESYIEKLNTMAENLKAGTISSKSDVTALREDIVSEILSSSFIKHLYEEIEVLHGRIDNIKIKSTKKLELNDNVKGKKYHK